MQKKNKKREIYVSVIGLFLNIHFYAVTLCPRANDMYYILDIIRVSLSLLSIIVIIGFFMMRINRFRHANKFLWCAIIMTVLGMLNFIFMINTPSIFD